MKYLFWKKNKQNLSDSFWGIWFFYCTARCCFRKCSLSYLLCYNFLRIILEYLKTIFPDNLKNVLILLNCITSVFMSECKLHESSTTGYSGVNVFSPSIQALGAAVGWMHTGQICCGFQFKGLQYRQCGFLQI